MEWFHIEKIDNETFAISEYGHWEETHCYLLLCAGKASYVKRNCEMIDNSRFCIVYYKEDYTPKSRKSGTKIAFTYAEKKKKNIIRFP